MKNLILFLSILCCVCACKTSAKNDFPDQSEAQKILLAEAQKEAEEASIQQQTKNGVSSNTKTQNTKTQKVSNKTNTQINTNAKEETPVQTQDTTKNTSEETKNEPQKEEDIYGKEIPMDLNNLPKFIRKTQDGRLIHPWFFAKILDQKPTKNVPLWFGEELNYKIGWSFINVGEATLIANKFLEKDGIKAYQVEAHAKSYSVIDAVFKVRDLNMSWVNEDFTKSIGYWQSVREGGYARDEWLNFDYKNQKYLIYKQNRHGELYTILNPLKGNAVFDILSALYYVRTLPLDPNNTIYFDVVNTGEQYPLKVIIHGKETIKTNAGKFDCIVVEPVISGEGIFVSKGKSLKVWLTNDEYRLPVKMSVEVFIGSVKAELDSYKKGGINNAENTKK